MCAERRTSGFSLIELVIVMFVISIGLLGLTGLFSNATNSLTTNEDLQRATLYAQQCAEQVLATRRNSATFVVSGGSALTISAIPGCATGDIDGFTRTADWANAAYTCPGSTTINCRDVAITVTKSPVSSSISVMLAEY